jgi:DNA invertase Pin-like site-specific DNA recombinase
MGCHPSLVGRVARGPREPSKLTPQQRQEVRARLKQGEPRDRIAEAYGVDVAAIKQVAR